MKYRGYAEAVHSLDENIGRLLDYLREIDKYDNTLIVAMASRSIPFWAAIFFASGEALIR